MANFAITLDSIYSALDKGHYETALQLCLRPEVAKFSLGKALLSYSYAGLRQSAKAMETAKDLAKTQPTDDSVIHTLGCTFKMLRSERDFSDLYEHALTVRPTEEQYLQELFASFCRQNDVKKMHFVAQKYYKAKPNMERYLFWSVTCTLLQDLPPQMMLLGEKTLYKALYDIRKTQQPSADEMALYCYVLLKQGKHAEALESLEQLHSRPSGPLLDDETHFSQNPQLVKMLDLQYAIHKLDLLIRNRRFQDVVTTGMSTLERYPDQWNVHSVVIDCLLVEWKNFMCKTDAPSVDKLKLDKLASFPRQDLSELLQELGGEQTHSTNLIECIQKTSEKVAEHLTYLRNLQLSNPKLRGPFLSELYLLMGYCDLLINTLASYDEGDVQAVSSFVRAVIQSCSCGDNIDGIVYDHVASDKTSDILLIEFGQSISTKITQYIERFKAKTCCFSDIKPYLQRLWNLDSQLQKSVSSVAGYGIKHIHDWSVLQKQRSEPLLISALNTATTNTAKSTVVATVSESTPVAAEENECDAGNDEQDDTNDGEKLSSSTASKKNKKSKKKKKKSAGSGTSAKANSDPVAENVVRVEKAKAAVEEHNDLLLLLCGYIKFDQVIAYCKDLMNEVPDWVAVSSDMKQRVKLYSMTREVFKNGLGGEQRTVQPGDELLQLNSSLFRRALRVNPDSVPDMNFACGWMRSLIQGREASPYSYAFKMDLIESYRLLGLGYSAYQSFVEMGVKHMQSDSMSYLVLPALLESGCYQDALNQSRSVVNFHILGRRDSLEMLGKAFQHGNYMKVLEISRFIDRCERSTQRNVSKSEIPMLEILLKHEDLNSAITYLNNYMDNVLPESHGLVDNAAIANMIDHLDFELQVRAEVENIAEIKRMCRQQMESRLIYAQHSVRLLFYAFENDIKEADVHFKTIIELFNRTSSGSFLSGSLNDSLISQIKGQSVYSGSTAFRGALIEVYRSAVKFCLSCLATDVSVLSVPPSSSASSPDRPLGFVTLEESRVSASAVVSSLIKLLGVLQDIGTFASESSKLGSSEYIKSVSAFIRTVGLQVPLLIQQCLITFRKNSEARANDSEQYLQSSAFVVKQIEIVVQELVTTLGKIHRDLVDINVSVDKLSLEEVVRELEQCGSRELSRCGIALDSLHDSQDYATDEKSGTNSSVSKDATPASKEVSSRPALQKLVAREYKSSVCYSCISMCAVLGNQLRSLKKL